MKGGGVEGVKGSSWVCFQMPTTTPRTDLLKKSTFLSEKKKILRIGWFFGSYCSYKSLILVHSFYTVVVRRYGLCSVTVIYGCICRNQVFIRNYNILKNKFLFFFLK